MEAGPPRGPAVTPALRHPSRSGSVWSSYRKSCVDMVMKWLVPESSGRYVNRMTNEALHRGGQGGCGHRVRADRRAGAVIVPCPAGCSLKVLADSERYTWIVL